MVQVDGIKMEGRRGITPVVQQLTLHQDTCHGAHGASPSKSGHTLWILHARADSRSCTECAEPLNALALQGPSTSAIVIEAVLTELGKYITEKLSVPTIGISACWTNGQVRCSYCLVQ